MEQNDIEKILGMMEDKEDPMVKRAKELLTENESNRREVEALQKAGKPIPQELMARVKNVFKQAINIDDDLTMKSMVRMGKRRFWRGLWTGVGITIGFLLLVSIIISIL